MLSVEEKLLSPDLPESPSIGSCFGSMPALPISICRLSKVHSLLNSFYSWLFLDQSQSTLLMETVGLGMFKTLRTGHLLQLHVLMLKKCSASRQALSCVMYIVTLFENHFASFRFLSNLRSNNCEQTSVRARRGRQAIRS